MNRDSGLRQRLRDIPPLRTISQAVDADCYNTVRVALRRLGSPLDIQLERPRLGVLADEQIWVAVAPWDEHYPLLLWSRFATRTRAGIHSDVSCQLELFDVRSGLIMRTALDALHRELRSLLTPSVPQGVVEEEN